MARLTVERRFLLVKIYLTFLSLSYGQILSNNCKEDQRLMIDYGWLDITSKKISKKYGLE